MAGLICSRCDRPRKGRGRYCADCRREYQRSWRVHEAERHCAKANAALEAAGFWVRLKVDADGTFHVKPVKQPSRPDRRPAAG